MHILHDKQASEKPITIENFVKDMILIENSSWKQGEGYLLLNVD